mgnify:FL=1
MNKEKYQKSRRREIIKHNKNSVWILAIVVVIAIIVITSMFTDKEKFEKNKIEKEKLEQEIENSKKDKEKDEELKKQREKEEQEQKKLYDEELKKKEEIEKNISEENKKNVQKLKNEIKEFKNTGNKENITQKELSNNIQKVIEKSSEKWSNTEKEKGEKALDIVRNHLGNNEYSYNLMDKINDNTYMVVVLDSNTREVIRILLFGFRKKYSSKGRIEIE